MRILLLFIAISLLLHALLIIFVPSLNIMRDKEKVVPISVEVVQKERPKAIVSKPAALPKPVVAQDKPKVSEVESKVAPLEQGAREELILPDIVVPITLTESDKGVALPDIKSTATKDNPALAKGLKVSDELKSQMNAKGSSKKTEKKDDIAEEGMKGMNTGAIYNFDMLPTNNRYVSYAPPPPKFALENDAKITIKFSIDKFGNTQDIIFVTRNDVRVERLAYDYVKQMKFNASISDDKDSAQIVIRFTVRK